MKTFTIPIDKPSKNLLNNLRNLSKAKEKRKEQMRSDWAKYFQDKD